MENTAALIKPEPPAALRWTVLIVISLAMFGNYYLYDCISPVADLLTQQLHFTDSNIGLLQSIYSLPNVFMVLLGGFIIDLIGTKKSSLIFSILCMVGALITVMKGDLLMMAAGRLIFGLGAESLIVAITTTLAKWFRGKQLSFAFGINLMIARLGSLAAQNSPSWAKSFYTSWDKPLWIAAIFGVISLVSVIIYYFLDTKVEKKYAFAEEGEQDKLLFKEIFQISKTRIFTGISVLALVILASNFLKFDIQSTIIFSISAVVMSIINYKGYKRSFWLIVLLCVTFYSAIFPFQTFAVKFFMNHFHIPLGLASGSYSIPTFMAIILTPIFGIVADKWGRRATLMMAGSLLIIPVYLILAYSSNSQVVHLNLLVVNFEFVPVILVPMIMMGIAYSLVPALMWPSVALLVDQSKLGTAYGLMTMIQNIGLASFNLIIGWANDTTHDYYLGMWIFSSLGFFGMLFAYLLKLQESKSGNHGLEYPKVETT